MEWRPSTLLMPSWNWYDGARVEDTFPHQYAWLGPFGTSLEKLKIILRSQSLRRQDEGTRDMWNPVAFGQKRIC